MNKTKHILSLVVMLLGTTTLSVSAASKINSLEAYTAANDTVADIDEEEYIASKDPTKLSRINRAKEEGQLNARDYIIENRFLPSGDRFVSKSFWDHFYLMSGFGIEKLSAVENYNIGNIATAHFGFGKDFTSRSTVRMYGNLEHSLRDMGDNGFSRYAMINGNIDYMYNLSSYLAGYNPQRPVNVSLFGGLGFGVTRNSYATGDRLAEEMKGWKFSGNIHAGLSFNIYGGPRSYFAIEPYIGVGTDQYDNSNRRNWHKYDLFYGVRGTYSYYLRPNIGEEAYNRIFSSWHYAGLDDREKSRVWQNPYFIELQAGPSIGNAGHNMGVYAGKWFSPAFGMRIGMYGRNAAYSNDVLPDGYSLQNRYTYVAFRVEGLINPFGFGKYYDWNRLFGAYLTAGLSYGRLDTFDNGQNINQNNAINVEAGLHAWLTVDKGIQFFVEPHLTRYERNALYIKRWATDVNVGFTVTSEARKYRDTYLPEEMPVYASIPSRLTFGIGLGRSFRQQTSYAYEGETKSSPIHNFTFFGEYRLSDYYSVRLGMEYLSLYDVTGNYSDPGGASNMSSNVINHTSHMALINLDPVFHLAPLMRGIDPYRKWNVDLAIGPTLSYLMGETQKTIEEIKAGNEPEVQGSAKIGANANMRISYKFTDQASIFLMPTLYFVKNIKYGHPSPEKNGWQFFQTLNLGVQYALAAPKRLSAFEDSLNIDRWRNPFFVEASSGVVLSSAADQAQIGGNKSGLAWAQSIAFGKWFAPIVGLRASFVNRSSEWGYYDWSQSVPASNKSYTEFFNENYLGGRVDVMVNPMGFFNKFTWDDQWGLFGFVGLGYGQKRMHRTITNATIDGHLVNDAESVKSVMTQNVTSINFGVHPWIKLSDDFSLFVEYLYSTCNSARDANAGYNTWHYDETKQATQTISLGLNMLFRTQKFRGLRDFMAMYDFKPWLSSRLRFGVAGGVTMEHNWQGHTSETGSMAGVISGYNGMVFGEYRFTDYVAGRMTLEYSNRGNVQQKGKSSNILLLSASFNANLTTLMGGFRARKCEFDAFIGPTVFFQDTKNLSMKNADKINVGAHVGLRASRFIDETHHMAIFFQPTIYALPGGGQSSFVGRISLMQTLNIGIHYTLK